MNRASQQRPPAQDDTGLGDVLRLALAESGAERAYVAVQRERGATFGLAAMARARADCPVPVSRSVVEQAFRARRPFVCSISAADPSWASGHSVRRLALASVAAAPLPPDARRGVLLLDSRTRPRASEAFLRDLVERLASVAGLLLGPSRPRRDPARETDGRDTWIRRVAATELPALILGETGSGKERVAARLHRESRRASGPLVAVNCAALNESLLDAELFGAVRGAYTGADRDRAGLFARARGGTLFLDEVGDMPAAMQARLLRVLETGQVLPVGGSDEVTVDVRIVAATHRDLRQGVARGTFREDLYHRLAVLELRVPPLRERLEELPTLVASLGPRLAAETGQAGPRLAPSAWSALAGHDWPGNVRELHAVLARAMLRSGGAPIAAEHLALGSLPRKSEEATLEHAMVLRAVRASGGNLAEAARRIGWTRQKLYRRMRVLGIGRGAQSGSDTTSSDSSTFQ